MAAIDGLALRKGANWLMARKLRGRQWKGAVSAYLITCAESGRSYVGICAGTVQKRWRDHLWTAKNGSPSWLHRAIRKRGAEAFTVEHVASARDWDDACELECLLIAQHDTFGQSGYNMTRGGDGTVGHVATPETLAKRSAALKGRIFSSETLAKIAEGNRLSWTPERRSTTAEQARVRMDDPIYKANLMASHSTVEYRAKIGDRMRGRKQSEEHLAKLSAVRRGRILTEEHKAKIGAASSAHQAKLRQIATPGGIHG